MNLQGMFRFVTAFFLWGFVILTASPAFAVKEQRDLENIYPPLSLRAVDIRSVSRVIIDGFPENGYSVDLGNREAWIVFPNFESSFLKDDLQALSGFQNIAGAEIIEREGKTLLKVKFKCECQADVYTWKDKKVVMDVYSIDALKNPIRGVVHDLEKPEKQEVSQEKPEEQKPIETPVVKIGSSTKPEDKEAMLKDFREMLRKAETEGVVQFKKEFKREPGKTEAKSTETEQKVKVAAKAAEEPKKVDPNYKNPFDEVLEDKTWLRAQTERCLPNTAFHLPENDLSMDDFYNLSTKYRTQLVEEFDKIDPEVVLKLAAHYASYGLGDEAVQTLHVFDTPDHRGYILQSMAELFTNRKANPDSIFAHADKCDGLHRLWGAFWYLRSGDEEKAAKLADFGNAALVLADLPQIIQSEMGTELALALVRQGKIDNAERLINQIAKVTNQFTPSVLLVRGLIDAQKGYADKAIALLEEVMSKNVADIDRVGISLSELKLAQSVPLNNEDVSLLEQALFLRAHYLEGALALSLIAEDLSRHDRFYEAFLRLSQNEYQDNKKNPVLRKARDLFNRLAVAGEGSDIAKNLSVFWDFPQLIPKEASLYKAFAGRLVQKGYDSAAIDVLNKGESIFPSDEISEDFKLLKAEAYYNIGDYHKALAVLEGLNQFDENYMLQAKILAALGQFDMALTALDLVKYQDVTAEKARYALQAENWNLAKDTLDKLRIGDDTAENEFSHDAAAYMAGKRYKNLPENAPLSEKVFLSSQPVENHNLETLMDETDDLLKLFKQGALYNG